jgi:hypothetical protein
MDFILCESQFHRCLLTACFELVRFAFQVEILTLNDTIHLFDAQNFCFSLIIEMVHYSGIQVFHSKADNSFHGFCLSGLPKWTKEFWNPLYGKMPNYMHS